MNKLLRICAARAYDPAVPRRNRKIAANFKNGVLNASAQIADGKTEDDSKVVVVGTPAA